MKLSCSTTANFFVNSPDIKVSCHATLKFHVTRNETFLASKCT
jgi:hypothetical protein